LPARTDIALAALLVAPAAVASADPAATPEPPRVIVGAGIGVSPNMSTSYIPGDEGRPSEYYVDGLYRPIARAPILALLDFGRGWSSANAGGPGSWWQLRAGAEILGCLDRGRHACGFVDAAIGLLRSQFESFPGDVPPGIAVSETAATLSLRLGGDIGIAHLRFRITGDLVLPIGQADLGSPTGVKFGAAFAF
jgi:hypothetical protein